MKTIVQSVIVFAMLFGNVMIGFSVSVDHLTIIPYSKTVTSSWYGQDSAEVLRLKSDAETSCIDTVKDLEWRLGHLALKLVPYKLNPRNIEISPKVELLGGGDNIAFLGYQCSIQLSSHSLDYIFLESDSEVKDINRECIPILDRNEKNRNVLYQDIRSGWSLFNGDWCAVHLVELIRR